MILVPGELKRYSAAERMIVFSAKEALYKVLFPEVGRLFGFEAARVQLARTGGEFTLVLAEELTSNLPAGLVLEGSYIVVNEFVLTWIWFNGTKGRCDSGPAARSTASPR